MTRRSKKTCAAAIAALSAAAIMMAAPAHAQIAGFGDGSAYTLNHTGTGDPASISGGNLNITTAVNDQANSAWYNTPQSVAAFNASYTFSWTGSSTAPNNADGYTFAIQNIGTNAIGGGGGEIAYEGTNGSLPNVSNSYAIGFDGFNGTSTTDISIEQGINSGLQTPIDTGMQYANGPITVQISYDGATVAVKLTQGTTNFSQSYNANIPDAIESPTAYIGFTGATGGYNMGQQISNFVFTPKAPTATSSNPPPGLINISSAADVVVSVDAGGILDSTGSHNSGDGAVTNLKDNNYSTKYLNFTGNTLGGAGFTDTPAYGSSVVRGLAITSANDSPERDPSSYVLYGSNDGTFSASSPVISQGSVPTFTDRFETQYVTFANSTAYTSYELMFPTVSDMVDGTPTTANSMAVSEVRFLAAPEPGAPAALALGGLGLLCLLARRRKAAA